MRHPYNIDVNACYGLLPDVRCYLSTTDVSGLNPSSIHYGGQRARVVVENARESVRSLLKADDKDRVVFTSGATEANNTVILSLLLCGEKKGSIVTTAVEHPSVLAPMRLLKKFGYEIIEVKPDRSGYITEDMVLERLRDDTILVSIMLANNETGVIYPVGEIAKKIKSHAPHVLLHCDAAQAVGKIDVNFQSLHVDALTMSGHKIGSLTGVGALVWRYDADICSMIYGGEQEYGCRAGTENVTGIATLGVACDCVRESFSVRIDTMRRNRDLLLSLLSSSLHGITVHCEGVERLPNTLNIAIHGINGQDLVAALDLEGVYISSGSACSSG
ncbi:MAG: cysteine desulfurase, partial [Candidatus Dadabacteria bacterium]